MRFKLDENLPVEVVELLREAGHDAATILEQDMGGERDPDVAAVCQHEVRALITFDTGFADIRAYPPEEYAGLLVFRLRQQDKLHVFDVLRRMLPLLDREEIDKRLWIVEEDRVRVRAQ